MDVHDVPRWIGEGPVGREDLPADLRDLVDDALAQGLVLEDCREHLFAL